MTRMGVGYVTKQFFLTTTLHGFKYLCTGCNMDRICWISWCVASAGCAGALCAVLWARYLQVPALLVLRSASAAPLPLPTVAVCLPALSTAYLIVGNFSIEKEISRHLVFTFSRILEGKEAPKENLILLEQMLTANNVDVPDALYENMPPCREFVKRCRWQDTMVPCQKLFRRELTAFGVCCVIHPNRLKHTLKIKSLDNNKRLSLLLQCSKNMVFYGCQVFTKYESQDAVEPVMLTPGSSYLAQLTYQSVQDGGGEKLVGDSCVSGLEYSRTECLNKCMEKLCGCSDPFRTIFEDENDVPPPCSVSQINCLRKTDNSSCNCMPACGTLTTDLELQHSVMKSAEYAIDPLYAGIDVGTSTVLELRVMVRDSRVFTRQPTQTWFTLLSSLGGVFNMFLGFGLFSALELLFFLLVRLPPAIKHAPEMDMSVTRVRTNRQP